MPSVTTPLDHTLKLCTRFADTLHTFAVAKAHFKADVQHSLGHTVHGGVSSNPCCPCCCRAGGTCTCRCSTSTVAWRQRLLRSHSWLLVCRMPLGWLRLRGVPCRQRCCRLLNRGLLVQHILTPRLSGNAARPRAAGRCHVERILHLLHLAPAWEWGQGGRVVEVCDTSAV